MKSLSTLIKYSFKSVIIAAWHYKTYLFKYLFECFYWHIYNTWLHLLQNIWVIYMMTKGEFISSLDVLCHLLGFRVNLSWYNCISFCRYIHDMHIWRHVSVSADYGISVDQELADMQLTLACRSPDTHTIHTLSIDIHWI